MQWSMKMSSMRLFAMEFHSSKRNVWLRHNNKKALAKSFSQENKIEKTRQW